MVSIPVPVDSLNERHSAGLCSADDSDEERKLPWLPDGSELYARELTHD